MTKSDNQFDANAFLRMVSAQPGVYIFTDRNDKTLYVGKAANLKNRLASYFRASGLSAKTRLMVSKIHRAEIQQTRTESEALLLENNLIKDKRPRYNISLRDDKSFPYIRLSEGDEFPRFSFYRGRRTRPHQYYGPYPNASAVREMLAQIHKIFRLRQCTNAFFRNRSRPCLQYQIKRCSAPCVGRIAREDYLDDVRQAQAMLGGNDFALLDELASKMERAATALDYETAARYRDRIALLQRATARQYVSKGRANADVVTVALESDSACFGVVSVRHGRNLGARFYLQKNPLDWSAGELLAAFLPQHYLGALMPAEILLGEKIAACEALQHALAQANKSKVTLKHRCRAERARWIETARINTADHLRAHLGERSQMDAQFAAMTDLLRLPEMPSRIECFDISHTMGERTVGSCVVFDRQGAVKSAYRKFNVEGITPGDDYAAMQQTLERRYKRVLQDDGKLPDLIIIDGGKGQLRIAAHILEELQILSAVRLLAVSKDRARRHGGEQLHWHGVHEDAPRGTAPRTITPDKGSKALRLIQRIRDEAHRFAITGHRRRRAKARNESPLQRIEGVGDTRRRNLLRYFGGLREITRAGVEDLAKVPGISAALAARIHREFHDEG